MLTANLDISEKKLLSKGRSLDFIFFGGGPLHIAGFNAFIYYLNDSGKRPSGIVINGADDNRKHQFNIDSIIAIAKADYIYTEQKSMKPGSFFLIKTIKTINAKIKTYINAQNMKKSACEASYSNCGPPIYLITGDPSNVPDYMIDFFSLRNRRIVYVPIEEGTGTYRLSVSDWRKLPATRTDNFFKRVKMYAKIYLLGSVNDKIQKAFKSSVECFNFTLFNQSDASISPNKLACKYQSYAFDQMGRHCNVGTIDYKNSVIILGTNSDAFNAADFELSVLEDAICLIESYGFNVIFRPHPAIKDHSRYKKLGVPIDTNQHVPLEVLVARAEEKPCAIMGFLSSSQVFCNLLWDIPGITLDGLVKKKGLSYSLRNFFELNENSRSLFKSYVTFSNSAEDISNLLSNLKADCSCTCN